MGFLEDAAREYGRYRDRSDNPATPPADRALLFFKDGKLHQIDDQGTVTDLTETGGGGGGSGVWEHVGTATAASDGDDLTVDSISTDYNAFRVTFEVEGSGTGTNTVLRLNNDSGANYENQRTRSGNTTVEASGAGDTEVRFYWNAINVGARGGGHASIQKLASGAHAIVHATTLTDRGSGGDVARVDTSARWNNTSSKITRIDLLALAGQFAAGSRMIVEGTKQ